jgi:Domain of unknown function (DU1801)
MESDPADVTRSPQRMAIKTQKTERSVSEFLATVGEDARRQDCEAIVRIMERAVKAPPKMWGSSIIGFGDYSYQTANGKENDWFLSGFSPRKQDLTLYIMAGFDRYDALMAKLGKYKTGKSCLYIKRLADIDATILEDLIGASVARMKASRT